jgi:signal transduction histidine kinase
MTTPHFSEHRRWRQRAQHALAHSLRVRLLTMFLLLALGMVAIFGVGMQYALSVGWRDAARPLVIDFVDKLAAEIGSPPSVERAQALVQRLPLSVIISGPQVNWRSNPNARQLQYQSSNAHWERDEPRLFERVTADGHRIHFGLSAEVWNDRPRFTGWATLAALLALTAVAYARVRRMLRPLEDIRSGALRFGSGDFSQDIPIRNIDKPDELGELAATINKMGTDIHQMLEAKRSLLLAISHELRSPLTRARLNTELLPETPDVQPSRDALLRDLALMRDLVTDLLESERLASRHEALHREPTDLAALVASVILELPAAVSVRPEIAPDLPLLNADPVRIRLLVRNLLDNAVRHSVNAARNPIIRVQARANGGAVLSVRDFGPGVPEDQLALLGQAFYRPDASRTREGGGVGLGLYLCRLVVQAHGGSFKAVNADPGLEITVELA